MDKVVLGFAPTRRAIFSAPAAVVYRGLTAKRLKELNVDFVDIDDVNDEGLLYDDAGMEKIYEKFRDAKVDGLFELCKSCTHIFFIIFQSSLIINLLHRNFFIHILKDTSVFVLLLFHSSVCYALQAPLLSKKCRNRRIHFCQKGTDSKQIHSR